MNSTVEIRTMRSDDYSAAIQLWRSTPGIALTDADRYEAIEAFLERNAGLSLVAIDDGRLVGAVLVGHDGRRGFLHHLAVAAAWRGRGLGRRLVERALDGLAAAGIEKAHLFVLNDHPAGLDFWRHLGWVSRPELTMFSRATGRPTGETRRLD